MLFATSNVLADNPSNEEFYEIDDEVKDKDKDGYHDTITFEYDPDTDVNEEVNITVDIEVFLDDRPHLTLSEDYVIFNADIDYFAQNFSADENGTYDFYVTLFDEQGNQEDWYNVTDVNLTKLGDIDDTINVDMITQDQDDDGLINDLSYFAHIEDEGLEGVNIRIFRNSILITNGTTESTGEADFKDLSDGDYQWDAIYNGSQLQGEGGAFHIEVAERNGSLGYLYDFDGDEDYNDFYISVHNETQEGQADGYFEIYNETDDLVDSGNTDETWFWTENVSITNDLPQGNYTFFIYQEEDGQLLQNGSFHAYPNGSAAGGGKDYDEYFWDIGETLSDEDDDREDDTVTFSYDIDVDELVYVDVVVEILVYLEFEYLSNFSDNHTVYNSDAHYFEQNYTVNKTGNYTFEVMLYDDRGRLEDNYETEKLELVAQGEGVKAPTAEITEVDPRPAKEGETVSFSGEGEDEDGTVENYQWESSLDGILSNRETFDTDQLSVGNHDIYFRVQDNDNVWSDDDFVALEVTNEVPEGEILSPADETVYNLGVLVNFSARGSDVVGNIQGYLWESDLDGQISVQGNFSIDTLSRGTHTITMKVQDDEDEWSPAQTIEIKINGPPEAETGPPNPQLADEGELVRFAGEGDDPDGELKHFEWRSSEDGFLSDKKSFSISNLTLGNHTIYYRVQDEDGLWSDWATTYVVVNGLPIATIDSVLPVTSQVGDTVNFLSSVWDPDDYVVEVQWVSSVDGELTPQANFTTKSLSYGVHILTLKALDSRGAWSKVATITITVNSPPTATIDDPTHVEVEEGEKVQFLGLGEDLDGTIQAYSWRSTKDGILSTESFFETDELTVGNHTIFLKVQDESGVWSEEVSFTVTITEKAAGGGGGGDDDDDDDNTMVFAIIGLVALVVLAGGGFFMYQRNQAGGSEGGPGSAGQAPAGSGATSPGATPEQPAPQEPQAPAQPQVIGCPHCASQMSVAAVARPVVLTCPTCSGQLTLN